MHKISFFFRIPETQIAQHPTTAHTDILQTQVPELHHSTDLVHMPTDDDVAEADVSLICVRTFHGARNTK